MRIAIEGLSKPAYHYPRQVEPKPRQRKLSFPEFDTLQGCLENPESSCQGGFDIRKCVQGPVPRPRVAGVLLSGLRGGYLDMFLEHRAGTCQRPIISQLCVSEESCGVGRKSDPCDRQADLHKDKSPNLSARSEAPRSFLITFHHAAFSYCSSATENQCGSEYQNNPF